MPVTPDDDDDQLYTHQITVQVTHDQYQAIRQLARDAGMRTDSLITAAVRTGLSAIRSSTPHVEPEKRPGTNHESHDPAD